MGCIYSEEQQPARPLSELEARKEVGPSGSKQDIEQAQKLFTCCHGRTVNWKQVRRALEQAILKRLPLSF
jgi:hypothetical protein